MIVSEDLFDKKLKEVAILVADSSIYYNNINLAELSARKLTINNARNLDSSIVFQIFDINKNRLNSSEAVKEHTVTDFNNRYEFENFNSTRWRSLMVFFESYQRWVWVAEKHEFRFQLAESIILESIIPSLIIIPVIGLIIFFIVQWGLRPISLLSFAIENKKINDLSPIIIDDTPSELSKLTGSVNQLFSRLSNSFDREKRLASDAAHEIKTPIATLKLQVENLLAENIDNPDLIVLKQTANRLSHLTEQILTLNKTTPELFVNKMQRVNIAPILRLVVAQNFSDIDFKEQTIEFEDNDCFIKSDHFAIETLFGNLLINAIKYTPEGGKLRVKLYPIGSKVILELHDNGIGIPIDKRQRVLERFYRLNNHQRQSEIIGCGLGFSIVQHIVELHNASFDLLDSEFITGLMARVVFNLDE